MLIYITTENQKQVAVTDEYNTARRLSDSIPVIGVSYPASDENWSGIAFLAEGFEAVDEEYAQLVCDRFYHEPVVRVKWQQLCIRESKLTDAEGYIRLYQDEAVKRYIEAPVLSQKQLEWETWIAEYEEYVYRKELPAMWVLSDEKDCFMGRMGLEWHDRENAAPQGYYLGYALLPEYRKKGLAASAASRLCAYCIEQWELDDIYLICESSNTASVKTALKAGFECIKALDNKKQEILSSEHVRKHILDNLTGICTCSFLLFLRKS